MEAPFNLETKDIILNAIRDFQILEIKYRSGANSVMSTREIQPLALYFEQNYWMVVAFCRLRRAHREFRLDRMEAVSKVDDFFPPHQFKLSGFYR